MTRASVEGEGHELFSMVDGLTVKLLVGQPEQSAYFAKAATRTTDSLEALKAFFEGERAVRATVGRSTFPNFYFAKSERSIGFSRPHNRNNRYSLTASPYEPDLIRQMLV